MFEINLVTDLMYHSYRPDLSLLILENNSPIDNLYDEWHLV
jgi:hypothetical protein